jgi:hypothetical protein
MTEKTFSNAAKYREIMRELRVRQSLFPHWVADKKIRQEIADYRIAILQAIAEDYAKLVEQDEPRRGAT